jgi:hypothetical protein
LDLRTIGFFTCLDLTIQGLLVFPGFLDIGFTLVFSRISGGLAGWFFQGSWSFSEILDLDLDIGVPLNQSI